VCGSSPSGLNLTPFALAIRARLEAMAASAEAIARDAASETQEASGVVRLTTSEIIGAEVLPAILADFAAAHPRVTVELNLSNASEDVLRREADIAVRTYRPAQGALLARRIGAVPIRLYAHRRYLARRGVPDRLDAPGHVAIGYDRDPQTARSLQELGLGVTRETFGFRADNQLAQLAALRAGLGVGACQTPIARRDPDLVPVPEAALRFELELWVAMHEDLKSSRRMRLMFDALVDGLGAYVAGAAAA
jgi:DNA-binding transcriptional LysR family regulator